MGFSGDGKGLDIGRMYGGGRNGDSSCDVKTHAVGSIVHVAGFGQKGPKRPAREAVEVNKHRR